MLKILQIEQERNLREWNATKGRIDFEPTYQRKGNLWSKKNQQLLINTILNEYDFPKIYLADFSYGVQELNEKSRLYAIIDGKQRLSTIFSFFEDELLLDNTPVYFKEVEYNLTGLNYSALQSRYPRLAERFDTHRPTVMSVIADKPEDIYEMFIRLNLSVYISGPEKRNAMPGPLPGLIRKIAIDKFFSEKANFSSLRGQDLDAAAKLLYMEANNGYATIKKQDLDAFVVRGKSAMPELYDVYVNRTLTNLSILGDIFIFKDPLLQSRTQLPVYYSALKELQKKGVELNEFREFLVKFEIQRRDVKKMQKARSQGQIIPDDKIDSKLIDYNTLIRSPDDKSAIISMTKTLVDEYIKYVS